MNVLDLFSGIGGFSLGLERAGWRAVAFCERDAYCRRVLAARWPQVLQFDDVRTLAFADLAAAGLADIDAICGGFPCQDISNAGKRAGIEGARSGLWRSYARLVGELRPRFVIVENVAALLNRGMGRVLGDLAALGYDAWWDRIRAFDVGAPHYRARIWIVAWPGGSRPADFAGRLGRAIGRRCADAFSDAHGLRQQQPAGGGHQVRLRPAALRADLSDTDLGGRPVGETLCAWQSEPGGDGEAVPNADRDGHGGRRRPGPHRVEAGRGKGKKQGPVGQRLRQILGRGGEDLPDAAGAIAQGRWMWASHRGWPEPPDVYWGAVEPALDRVVDGFPGRVDQCGGLGNAVVPLIPEIIARAIEDALR